MSHLNNGTDTLLQLTDNTYQFPQYYRLKGIIYWLDANQGFKVAFNNQYLLNYVDVNGNTMDRFLTVTNNGQHESINGYIPIDLYINQVYFGSSTGTTPNVILVVDFTDTISK